MMIPRFALYLLFVTSNNSFAARIDLSAHTTDLIKAVRTSFPIEDRFFDEDENKLLVRGDHEIILADPNTISRAELSELQHLLSGQAISSGFRLVLQGNVALRDPSGQPVDLDDANLGISPDSGKTAALLRQFVEMLDEPRSGTRAPGELVDLSRLNPRFFTLNVTEPEGIDLSVFPDEYDIPEMIAESMPGSPNESLDKRAGPALPRAKLDFTAPIRNQDRVESPEALNLFEIDLGRYVPVEIWVRAVPGRSPEDLARDNYDRLSREVLKVSSAMQYVFLEVDDADLSSVDRIAFRQEFRRRLDDGSKNESHLIPGNQISVHYTVRARDTCDRDLAR